MRNIDERFRIVRQLFTELDKYFIELKYSVNYQILTLIDIQHLEIKYTSSQTGIVVIIDYLPIDAAGKDVNSFYGTIHK